MIRTYSELRRLETFQERLQYLTLHGAVGRSTFGHDRWLNQKFYTSAAWKDVRRFVLLRDEACDLGIEGYDIHAGALIHHMNPLTIEEIVDRKEDLINPEYLITTTHQTHNAIHYGVDNTHFRNFQDRKAGDTKLW